MSDRFWPKAEVLGAQCNSARSNELRYFTPAVVAVIPKRRIYLGKSHVNRLTPDVCMLDIGMPNINGNQLAHELRQLPASKMLCRLR